MSTEKNSRNSFTIPGKRSGRRFRETVLRMHTRKVSVQTATGKPFMNLQVEINLGGIIPRVFQIPLQAVVSALSVIARIFRFKIVFHLNQRK